MRKKLFQVDPFTDTLIGIIFAGICWLSPLPFGAVQSSWSTILIGLAIATSILILIKHWPLKNIEFPPGSKLLLAIMILGLLGGVIQVIPLPGEILSIISPGAARYYFSGEAGNLGSISLNPQQTLHSLALGTGAIALFFSVLIYQPSWTTRQHFFSLLLLGLLVSGFILSLIGIISYFRFPGTVMGIHKIGRGNPFGPFVNRNHFAGYIEMIIPLGMAVFLARPGKKTSSIFLRILRKTKQNDPRRLLVAFMTMTMIVALLVGGSRGGVVSLGSGIICLIFMGGRMRIWSGKNSARLITMVIIILIWFGAWFGWGNLSGRFSSISPSSTRFQLWKDTLSIARDHPLLGTGLGTFSQVFPSYRSFPSNYTYTHTENDYLQLLAELGIWGLLVLIAGGTIWTRLIWEKTKYILPDQAITFIPRFQFGQRAIFLGCISGMAALSIHGLVNFNFHIPSNLMIFCILAGISLNIGTEKPKN